MPLLVAIACEVTCEVCATTYCDAYQVGHGWQAVNDRDCEVCGHIFRLAVSIRTLSEEEKEEGDSVRSHLLSAGTDAQAPSCHEDLALTINSSGGGGSSSPVPVMSADPHRDRVRSVPPQGTNRVGKAGVAPSPPEPLGQLLKKGRPRLGEVRPKPWIKAGMSERTWYRRQKEKSLG